MDSPAAGSAPYELVEVTSYHQCRHDITYAIFECASYQPRVVGLDEFPQASVAD